MSKTIETIDSPFNVQASIENFDPGETDCPDFLEPVVKIYFDTHTQCKQCVGAFGQSDQTKLGQHLLVRRSKAKLS